MEMSRFTGRGLRNTGMKRKVLGCVVDTGSSRAPFPCIKYCPGCPQDCDTSVPCSHHLFQASVSRSSFSSSAIRITNNPTLWGTQQETPGGTVIPFMPHYPLGILTYHHTTQYHKVTASDVCPLMTSVTASSECLFPS